MTCGRCGSSLFAVHPTAMLGIVGAEGESFAAGELVCGSCGDLIDGVSVTTGPPTAYLSEPIVRERPGEKLHRVRDAAPS